MSRTVKQHRRRAMSMYENALRGLNRFLKENGNPELGHLLEMKVVSEDWRDDGTLVLNLEARLSVSRRRTSFVCRLIKDRETGEWSHYRNPNPLSVFMEHRLYVFKEGKESGIMHMYGLDHFYPDYTEGRMVILGYKIDSRGIPFGDHEFLAVA